MFWGLGIFLFLLILIVWLNGWQGSSLRYWERSCSYRVSTIRGLHIMLTRDTKASLSPTYLLCSLLSQLPSSCIDLLCLYIFYFSLPFVFFLFCMKNTLYLYSMKLLWTSAVTTAKIFCFFSQNQSSCSEIFYYYH